MRSQILAAGLLAVVAALPARAEDIFGAGNELSNVQGGVPQAPRGAPPPLAMVPSAENRSLCDRHFSGMAQADRRKIDELGRSSLTGAQRSAAYRAYIDERDAFSKRCGATFAGTYDARIQQSLAHGRHNFPVEAFPVRPPVADNTCELPCYNPAGGRPPFRGTPETVETPPPPPPTNVIVVLPPATSVGPVGGTPPGAQPQDGQTRDGPGSSQPPAVAAARPIPPPPPGYQRWYNMDPEHCRSWNGTHHTGGDAGPFCDFPNAQTDLSSDPRPRTPEDLVQGSPAVPRGSR